MRNPEKLLWLVNLSDAWQPVHRKAEKECVEKV